MQFDPSKRIARKYPINLLDKQMHFPIIIVAINENDFLLLRRHLYYFCQFGKDRHCSES